MESDLQSAIAKYLDAQERLYKRFIWFHCPNGGQRSKRYARWLIGQGVKAGVPDIIIMGAGGKTVSLEIKFKKTPLSPSQKKFHAKLEALQHPIYTVRALTPGDAVDLVFGILSKESLA